MKVELELNKVEKVELFFRHIWIWDIRRSWLVEALMHFSGFGFLIKIGLEVIFQGKMMKFDVIM